MSKVARALRPLESEGREILQMLAKLTQAMLENRARLDKLEARLAPRLSLPGFIGAKEAQARTGCSLQVIYKWAANGRIVAVRVGGRIWIDAASLPRRN